MEIIRSIQQMQKVSKDLHRNGKTIALVPTMGALHQGHLSLLDRAQEECNVSVMSIFVNPIQFGPTEDFGKYPRPFDEDCRLAQERGCAYLFAPEYSEMYGSDFRTYVDVEGLTNGLCGRSRPGHFRGVATVVTKLFNIVNPHVAVFGQKDAQQALILRRMVLDLNFQLRMIIATTVREADGLAMSSRNRYLTVEERKEVPTIYAALRSAADEYEAGERSSTHLGEMIKDKYDRAQFFRPEYVECVDTNRLEPVETMSGTTLLAVACRTTESKTRLIDNIVLGGQL